MQTHQSLSVHAHDDKTHPRMGIANREECEGEQRAAVIFLFIQQRSHSDLLLSDRARQVEKKKSELIKTLQRPVVLQVSRNGRVFNSLFHPGKQVNNSYEVTAGS